MILGVGLIALAVLGCALLIYLDKKKGRQSGYVNLVLTPLIKSSEAKTPSVDAEEGNYTEEQQRAFLKLITEIGAADLDKASNVSASAPVTHTNVNTITPS